MACEATKKLIDARNQQHGELEEQSTSTHGEIYSGSISGSISSSERADDVVHPSEALTLEHPRRGPTTRQMPNLLNFRCMNALLSVNYTSKPC